MEIFKIVVKNHKLQKRVIFKEQKGAIKKKEDKRSHKE